MKRLILWSAMALVLPGCLVPHDDSDAPTPEETRAVEPGESDAPPLQR